MVSAPARFSRPESPTGSGPGRAEPPSPAIPWGIFSRRFWGFLSCRQQPARLWKSYIQLTEAEAAFRALKSELSIRPIFHQLERRAKAHILVAFLGYGPWVRLKHLLIRAGADVSPAKALALLGTLVSADIVMPTTDGHEFRLQRVTTPSNEQKRVLDLLGVAVPQRLSFNRECSVDAPAA